MNHGKSQELRLAHAEAAATAIFDFRLVRVAAGGHDVFFQHPDETRQAVASFLAGLSCEGCSPATHCFS